MKINLLFTSSTSALFELENDEIVQTLTPYTILINDKIYKKHGHDNVFSIYDLTPNTTYQLTLQQMKSMSV